MAVPLKRERRPEPETLEALELDLLLEAVFRFYGYDFRDYARTSMRRRIANIMRAEGVELTYPHDQTPPKAAFRAGIIGAGGGDFVRFTRSDVTYTIEHADGPRSGQYAGVTIHRGPKRVAELRCKGTPYDALGPDGFALIYRAKLPSELYGLE